MFLILALAVFLLSCDTVSSILASKVDNVVVTSAAAGVYRLSFVCACVCSKSEKFVRSCNLIHKLSQSNVDAMFPSSITLLPPDIARQIELESQKSEPADIDKYIIVFFDPVRAPGL